MVHLKQLGLTEAKTKYAGISDLRVSVCRCSTETARRSRRRV